MGVFPSFFILQSPEFFFIIFIFFCWFFLLLFCCFYLFFFSDWFQKMIAKNDMAQTTQHNKTESLENIKIFSCNIFWLSNNLMLWRQLIIANLWMGVNWVWKQKKTKNKKQKQKTKKNINMPAFTHTCTHTHAHKRYIFDITPGITFPKISALIIFNSMNLHIWLSACFNFSKFCQSFNFL